MAQKKKDDRPIIKKEPETTYSRSEILSAASGFGVSVELLAGALSLTDKAELTRKEVENAIHQFKTRRV